MNRFAFYIKLNRYKNNIIEHSGYKPATTHDYVAVLPNFWGDGKHRYFYSQQEWDNYNKNKGYAQNVGVDKAKKEKYNNNKNIYIKNNMEYSVNAGADRADNEKKVAEESVYTKDKIKDKIKGASSKHGDMEYDDIVKYTNEIKEFKDYATEFKKIMKKSIDTGEWPDYESFWNKTKEDIKNVAVDYFLMNDCSADTYNKARTIMEQELIKEWNNSIKKAKAINDSYKMNAREKEEKESQLKELDRLSEESIKKGKEIDLSDEYNKLENKIDTLNRNFMSPQQRKEFSNDLDNYLSEIREKELTDPKTGLKIKAEDMSIEDDMALINYHKYLDNDYDNKGYGTNCAMCTTAMVLRQKGYDVSANNIYDVNDVGYNHWDRFERMFNIADGVKVHNGYGLTDPKEFTDLISKEPVGSYGDLFVSWKNCDWSHSVFYYVESPGKVVLYETQSNKKINLEDYIDLSYEWAFTRLDNATLKTNTIQRNNWTKYS